MDYRTAYTRRLRAATRLRKRLAATALLGVPVCAAALLLVRQPAFETSVQPAGAYVAPAARGQAAQAPVRAVIAALADAKATARRVYPFSIVPGGVTSRDELLRVLKTDKVAAAHYAGFRADKASPVTVTKARAVYVSYRKGDKVYWTANKVMLAEGETLLSDGDSEIRGRCGNRISDLPQLPVAVDEPSPHLLDTAMELDGDAAAAFADATAADGSAGSTGSTGSGGAAQPHAFARFTNGAGLLMADTRAPAMLAMLRAPGGLGAQAWVSRGTASADALPIGMAGAQAGQDSGLNGSAEPAVPPSAAPDGAPAPAARAGDAGGTGGAGSAPSTASTASTPIITGGATSGTVQAPAPDGARASSGTATPAGAGAKVGSPAPTLPDALLTSTGLPATGGTPKPEATELPEPDGLALSAGGLAILLLLRRKGRPGRRA